MADISKDNTISSLQKSLKKNAGAKKTDRHDVMKGKRYLAKNMLFLTIGQFGTKLLSFFLVPLYTSVLTSTEYGTYDICSVTVSLFIPILTLNISDAAMRFLLDKDMPKEAVVSISVRNYFFGIAVFTLLIAFNALFNFIPIFNEYRLFLLLMFVVNGLSGIFLDIARGFDRIKTVSVSGVICSAVMITLNLVFLLPLHMGLKGYYLATILGSAVQTLYLFFSLRLFRFIGIRKSDSAVSREMLRYSCPMMLNSVSWWVNSVSDRYIVTWLCGIVQNGIYSVAYKIPSILNILQGIFSQAWTLSAVQDFDKDDRSGFFSDMYSFYNAAMVLLCSLIIIFTKPLARLLFANDFYAAWRFVPFLLISSVFGALSGYIGGIFAAVKRSKFFSASSFTGAVMNSVLNMVLIQFAGTIGAAIATFVSYFTVWVMRFVYMKRIIRLKVSLTADCTVYVILLVQSAVVLRSSSPAFSFSMNCALLALILVIYRSVIFRIARFVGTRIKRGDI